MAVGSWRTSNWRSVFWVKRSCRRRGGVEGHCKDALASRAWMPAARMLWPRPPEPAHFLDGKGKAQGPKRAGNVVSGREDLWAETASSLRRRSVLLRPRGKRD